MHDARHSTATERTLRIKRVLNAGSGSRHARQLHSVFAREAWQEIRIDINATVNPDVVGSVTDMSFAFPPQSFDAIWSSHILEHLHAHEVPFALREFRRVLKADGFALITCPDIEAVASFIVDHGVDGVAYISPAGPIAGLDLLYGHSTSIARGQLHMAHKTGFTCASLGQLLLDAGFFTVLAKRERFNLWAVALAEQADKVVIQRQLAQAGLDMFDHAP
jgi:SAM-dependent methyltransferase